MTTDAATRTPTTPPPVEQLANELINYMSALPQAAIRTVATLRIADHLAGGPQDVGTLARLAGASPGPLHRVLRYLAVRGFFVETAPGTFGLAPRGDLLRDDHPMGLRPHFDLDGTTHRMEQAYGGLLATVTSGRPAYADVHGSDLYADVEADPQRSAAFAAQMASRAQPVARALAAAHPWAGVDEVVDVGGGSGALLCALLQAHPHLRGTVVDLPRTSAEAEARIAQAGLGERARAVAGSFFDRLPAGADVYLLASILLDWPDEDAQRILATCAAACRPGARVLVVDWFATPEANPVVQTHVDVHQMVLVGGRVRAPEEVVALAAGAGLRHETTAPCGLGTSLLTFVR
jgi:SAM-dependent methyltransferase